MKVQKELVMAVWSLRDKVTFHDSHHTWKHDMERRNMLRGISAKLMDIAHELEVAYE